MSAGDYFPAHYSVLFPSIQQSIIRVSPAAFALWGKILTSTTSSNAFCIVCSSEPDGGLFISSVPCHYFTAVGESSPPPDHTHVGFKTRPLLTEYFCLHRQKRYAHWFSLKRQWRYTDTWDASVWIGQHSWMAMVILCPRCTHIHQSELVFIAGTNDLW